LTGYRFSSPIPGMETKSLNKKVGYALIAASLLAAPGVQGSSTREIHSTLSARDAEGIQYVVAKAGSGEELAFYLPQGYRVVVGVETLNGERRLLIVLVKNSNGASFEELMEQDFPGLTRHDPDGTIITIFTPEGIVPVLLPTGAISLLPRGCIRGTLPNGSLEVRTSDGLKMEIIPNPAAPGAQGSNVQNAGRDNAGTIPLRTIRLPISSSKPSRIHYPYGYDCSITRSKNGKSIRVVIFPGGRLYDFEVLEAQGFPGFTQHGYRAGDKRMKIYLPYGLEPIQEHRQGIFMLPRQTLP
jgi:hypothetical protein